MHMRLQVGRCDRCGARIGGTSHVLDRTNRRAASELVQAVTAAAAAVATS